MSRAHGNGILLMALLLGILPRTANAQAAGDAPAVVIVHGAWGGGWDWKGVERELRAAGREVYRPTLTGLGERHHLASAEIGLDTHITDVANLIVWERLEDVILVGHSYGGMVITGVAERIPGRIRHIVYLDAMVPFDGECVLSIRNAEGAACGSVEAVQGQKDGLMVPGWLEPDTPPPHDVPHPAKTLVDVLHLADGPGRGRPATYILTREAEGQTDGFDWAAARARDLGWPVVEMIADHNPQRDKAPELAALLLKIR